MLTFLQASDGKKCLLPHWTQLVSFSQEISDYSRRFEYANMYQQLEWHFTHAYSIYNIYMYTLWLFNIAMENPTYKWRFLAGKIIYKWAIFHGYVK